MRHARPPLLLLAAALLSLAQCKKDDPQADLPAATQTGANTAGCLINGQAFMATGSSGGLFSGGTKPLYGGFAFDSIYYLEINGQVNGKNTTLTLFLRSHRAHRLPLTGTYLLNKKTSYYPQSVALYALNHATYAVDDNSNEVYGTDPQHAGQVILTRADTVQHISAGTFEFTAASQTDPTKTITITSGRFDRKQ